MAKGIKKAFKTREKLLLLLFPYLTIFLFVISFRDTYRMLDDFKDKETFEVRTFKIDTIETNYSGIRGSNTIYIKESMEKKFVLYGYMANGIVPPIVVKQDSIRVFYSTLRRNYVYLGSAVNSPFHLISVVYYLY